MIYLDYAAATPLSTQAQVAMEPFWRTDFFNPSSPYLPAKRVREVYEKAKDQLAHTIGAKGNDLVVTAGATESINLAFTALKNVENPHALILSTEHASVRAAANATARVTEIKVKPDGRIDLTDFKNKLDSSVNFISVALVNNELGTIQPFSDIVELIRVERLRRLKSQDFCPVFFHSDASQALNLIDVNISRLGVDLLTINAAKVYGPKGVGALYVSHDVKLSPLTVGGGQERGLRSGTENVAGLVGFTTAAVYAKQHLSSNRKKYLELRQVFQTELTQALSEISLPSVAPVTGFPLFLGNPKHQLANFCPLSFPGLDAERLIYLLEEQEVYLATGAACAASKGEKSHVLQAIGLSDAEIAGSLRISMGEGNTPDTMKLAARAIAAAVRSEFTRLQEQA